MSSQMPSHAAMVRKETFANTVATAVIAAVLSWAIFRGKTSIVALAPPIGGIFGVLPGTFNFTLLVTLALTMITRRRVSAGVYRRLGAGEGAHLGARLPANIILRALTLAALATVVFVPVGAGLVWGATRIGALPVAWSFAGMLLYFVVYFSALSMAVTPPILWRALRD